MSTNAKTIETLGLLPVKVIEGKTVVRPKCDNCVDGEHEYCAKRCGCDCWKKN